MTPSIRRADLAHVPAAAAVLATAFADYAWTRWSVPAAGFAARLEELQALYLAHAVEHGLVLVSGDAHAVAALLPPDAPAPAIAVQERVAELHGDRLPALLDLALPERPAGAWDLATLGVRPEQRGRGLGAAMISAALALTGADSPGCAVALETSDDRNVRLYERHGFVTTARTEVPGGPVVFSMVRWPTA